MGKNWGKLSTGRGGGSKKGGEKVRETGNGRVGMEGAELWAHVGHNQVYSGY